MATVDQLKLNLASSWLDLTDVMVTNSGLYVDTGVLTLPPSLNESVVTLRQVSITSNGLEIGGGTVQMNLPDINVGDGSKVRFSKMSLTLDITDGVYTYSIDGTLDHFIGSHFELVLHVDGTGSDEGMDTFHLGLGDRITGSFDI